MVSLMLLPSVASVEESVLLTAPYRSISTTRLPTRCVVQAESQSSMVFSTPSRPIKSDSA